MLLCAVGSIELKKKIKKKTWCGNFFLDGVKYGFYTPSLPNSDSTLKSTMDHKYLFYNLLH